MLYAFIAGMLFIEMPWPDTWWRLLEACGDAALVAALLAYARKPIAQNKL